MPKHHQRGPRHSSTHPRPHAHASIHNTPSRPHSTPPATHKRKRINPLNVYTAHDTDRTVEGRGGRDRRYDWDSQERYEYELPDQFVDEEVDEEEAFDEAEEDKYGEIVNSIMARQSGAGRGGKGQKGGKQRGKRRQAEDEEEEEEKEEGQEQTGDADAAVDDGGVNEDDAMDEGMTTLSAMLDEPDDAENEDEHTTKYKSQQPSKQQKARSSKPPTELERAMERVKRQMEAEEEDGDVEENDEEGMEEQQEQDGEDEEAEDEQQANGHEEEEVEDDEHDEEEAERLQSEAAQPSRRLRETADEEDEDDDEDDDEDEEADSASKRAHLLSMIEQLGDETEADERSWRRKDRFEAQTETAVVEESEFAAIHMRTGAAATGTATTSSKLTLADLMQSLQGSAAPTTNSRTPAAGESKRSLAQLKKKLSVLSSTSTSASTGTLTEPLPDVRQDQITRRLGYTQVKQELERWTPIIERHRDATNLHFPLHAPTVPKATSETMAAAFRPTAKSELERDLERIMREYGVKERRVGGGGSGLVEGVEEAELKGRELTEEEVERRRAELGKMKSLLFHHEMKQRRINKIKSKTYRRLRKKLKDKSQLSPEELQLLDPEEAERRRLKAEVERVKERMTLAHTNRSAWMRRQMRVNANVQSGEVKQALEQSQAMAQRLKRKIDSADTKHNDSDESDDEPNEHDDEDMEDDGDELGEEGGSRGRTSKAAQLRAALRSVQEEGSEEEKEEEYIGFDRPPTAARDANKVKAASSSGNKSGLLGLKFMQRAMEEKRGQAREAREQLEDELKDELKREVGDSDENEDEKQERKKDRKDTTQQRQSELKGKRKLGGGESSLAARRDELVGAEREQKSVLLPHSFQSASVGMGRGRRARVGAAIDVDVDGSAADGDEQLFEVEAFEEDGQQSATAAMRSIESVANNKAASKPARVLTNGKAADRLQDSRSLQPNGRYHQQQPTTAQQPAGSDDEMDATGDDNPWAQSTDVAGRKALRDDEQKKRRRKRHKSNAPTNSDTADSTVAGSSAVQLDVNSVLLSAGQAGAVDEEQQRLVAAAFAVGEDEEKQFADTKAAAISATVPTIEQFTSTLPGWGNWTGEGLQPRPPTVRQQREQREAQRKLLAAQQLALNSRRDSHLPHVIVSEQSDKRASKYLLQRLPFPYTSVDAYEQSLLQPLGKEWNAVEAHQKAVRPAVTITKGAIIEAVTYHDSEKERRQAERDEEEKRQREKQRDGTAVEGDKIDKAKASGKGRRAGERRGLEAGKRQNRQSK